LNLWYGVEIGHLITTWTIAIKKSSPGQTVDDLEKEKLLDGKALYL
jgi:hypothetical protein